MYNVHCWRGGTPPPSQKRGGIDEGNPFGSEDEPDASGLTGGEIATDLNPFDEVGSTPPAKLYIHQPGYWQ